MSISLSLVKTVMIVPAVVSGLWIVRTDPPVKDAHAEPAAATQAPSQALADGEKDAEENESGSVSGSTSGAAEQKAAPKSQPNSLAVSKAANAEAASAEQIVERRVRIEHLLVALDSVAQVTLQMSPDQSAWIEPVLVDLAEQTLELSTDEAVKDASTDETLDDLELTVKKLVNAVSRMVEPEMSL